MWFKPSYLFLLAGALLLCCKSDEAVFKKELASLEKRVQQLEETKKHPPLETPLEKVKSAMSGVREWALSIQNYSVDYGIYPKAANATINEADYGFCEVRLLGEKLFNYKPSLPLDPWGTPYLYWCSKNRKHYMVLSMGADAKMSFSQELQSVLLSRTIPGPMLPQLSAACFQDDIVWCNSTAVQWPSDDVNDCAKK